MASATRMMVVANAGLEYGAEMLQSEVQKLRGRKKMLTKVRSLRFSPRWVEARDSMTALALKSASRSALVAASLSRK